MDTWSARVPGILGVLEALRTQENTCFTWLRILFFYPVGGTLSVQLVIGTFFYSLVLFYPLVKHFTWSGVRAGWGFLLLRSSSECLEPTCIYVYMCYHTTITIIIAFIVTRVIIILITMYSNLRVNALPRKGGVSVLNRLKWSSNTVSALFSYWQNHFPHQRIIIVISLSTLLNLHNHFP